MRNWAIILLVLWHTLPAQENDTSTNRLPKWSGHIDVMNFQANYPALLLSAERQFDQHFAIHQELGPVIVPEAYGFRSTEFNKYFGFKWRTELRLYDDLSEKKNSRTFLALDFTWQQDQYILDYFRREEGFNRIKEGKITRSILGSHIRFGLQRIFAKGFVISYSVGFGRVFYIMNRPSDYDRSVNGNGIRQNPPLDPFTMNFRIKLGGVFSYLSR